MPWIAFVDIEVVKKIEEISSGDNEKDVFPEHSFLATCLRVGLTINDLKELSYIDVLKILISYLPKEDKKENKIKKATQKDIDRLLG